MTKYTLKVTSDFGDMYTGEQHMRGSKFTIEDEQRARSLCQRGLARIVAIEHPPKTGKRVLFISSMIYKIGGIETANRAIAEHFKTKNIAFVTLNADATATSQLIATAKWHDVYVLGEETLEADVAILQHSDSVLALDRIKADKVYQQVHSDLTTLKKVEKYGRFYYQDNDRISQYLAVSTTAKEALEREEGKKAVIVPNLMPEPKKLLKIVVLSRATEEKGIDRLKILADKIQKYTDNYVIWLSSAIEQYDRADELLANDHIVPIKPSVYATSLLDGADYLCQLSRSESFCYSVREALQRKVPVIVSDLAEFRKLVKNGENGYILADDIPDERVKQIVEKIPKPKEAYKPGVAPIWHRILEGKL